VPGARPASQLHAWPGACLCDGAWPPKKLRTCVAAARTLVSMSWGFAAYFCVYCLLAPRLRCKPGLLCWQVTTNLKQIFRHVDATMPKFLIRCGAGLCSCCHALLLLSSKLCVAF